MTTSAGVILSPPPFMTNNEEWMRKSSEWMKRAHGGHIANIGTTTLLSGTVTTVLTDTRISFFNVISFTPTTANAATEVATLYVASQSKGAATLTHANAATGDRTFKYSILG